MTLRESKKGLPRTLHCARDVPEGAVEKEGGWVVEGVGGRGEETRFRSRGQWAKGRGQRGRRSRTDPRSHFRLHPRPPLHPPPLQLSPHTATLCGLRCATLLCALAQRELLLDTEPLNAGVTVGGAEAFYNFSVAMSSVIKRVTTIACLDVKDCTDQGLYNLLVYAYWARYLPHTRKLVLPMEQALSYTLGHKRRCCDVDNSGRILNDGGNVPPVVHQFAKGSAGRALPRTRFWSKVDQQY